MTRRIAYALLSALLALASPALAQVVLDPSAAASPSYGQLAAQRIVTSAKTPISDIAAVMGTPPTITYSADFGNSSIIATAAWDGSGSPGARYLISNGDGVYFKAAGAKVDTNGVGRRLAGAYDGLVAERRNGHGTAVVFGTYAPDVDFALRHNGLSAAYMVYVTDPATGIRQRVSAADLTPSYASAGYVKLAFGSSAYRIIEIRIAETAYIYAINVATAYNIWPVEHPSPLRLGVVWDSYGDGVMSDAGTPAPRALGVTDYMAARLGVSTYLSSSLGGTGMVNAGGLSTFAQRVPDVAESNAGRLDLLVAPFSGNDQASADAVLQAAATSYYSALRAAQPKAIIVAFPSQYWNAAGFPSQARVAVQYAGFAAALGGDPNAIWIDSSPYGTGEAWLNGTSSTGINQFVIGPDNVHANITGAKYLGNRIADSIVVAIRKRYGL